MSENELARCPFGQCGGMAERYGEPGAHYIYCNECGVQSPTFADPANADAWWNARQPDARPAWLTEYIAAGKQLIAANEFGTPDEYCIAEVALTRAALAIPQEDGK